MKVGFFLLPEFSYFGIAAATEPLFIANWLARRSVFDWKIASVDGKPVRASNGRQVIVDGDLDHGADCRSVFVLASFDPEQLLQQTKLSVTDGTQHDGEMMHVRDAPPRSSTQHKPIIKMMVPRSPKTSTVDAVHSIPIYIDGEYSD